MIGQYKLTIEPTGDMEVKPIQNNVTTQQVVRKSEPTIFDDMAFAMPKPGRPKTLEGKYHIFTARIREDLFGYAQSITGKDSDYQSVNDYLNQLIARDMLSHSQKGNR